MLACDAHEAKTVKDGLVKPANGSKFGLNLFVETTSDYGRAGMVAFDNARGGGSSRRSSCIEPPAWHRSSPRRLRQACASVER